MEATLMFHPLSIFNRKRQALAPGEAYSTTDPFLRLQHEMNRLFDDAFAGFPGSSGGALSAFGGEFKPRIDVRESDNSLIIDAELPGVAEDDLDVQISDNMLTIRGEKRSEKKEEKGEEYHYVERTYGSFARSIPLPFDIDPDAVDAVFKDGILKLTLPKPPEAVRTSRKIGIKKG
jgi:HSP20 family protein